MQTLNATLISPQNNYLLIEHEIEKEEKTESGIVVTNHDDEFVSIAKVLNAPSDNNNLQGKTILFHKAEALSFKASIDGSLSTGNKAYYLLPLARVLAVYGEV